MNKQVKKEWVKRLLEEDMKPARDRVPAEYILNKMYEEATDDIILYKNKFQLKGEDGTIPDLIPVGVNDEIDDRVLEWAGLPDREVKLPSFKEINGCGIRDVCSNLYAIQKHGRISFVTTTAKGIGRSKAVTDYREVRPRDIANLINIDL